MKITPPPHLRLAITGHCSAEKLNAAQVTASLTEAFSLCAQALAASIVATDKIYDANSVPELTLISALAAGADQMAVASFRAADLPGMTRRLEVVLPMVRETYVDTMSPASAAQMQAMSASADAVLELADDPPDTASADEMERWREHRFTALGDILVRQGDVLLAVWDGVATARVGGTASVISLALREGLPVIWIDPQKPGIRLLGGTGLYGDQLTHARDKARELVGPNALAHLTEALKPCLLPQFSAPRPAAGATPEAAEPFDYIRSKEAFAAFLAEAEKAKARPPGFTWMTLYRWLLWLTGSDIKAPTNDGPVNDGLRPPATRSWLAARLPGLRLACDYVRDDLAKPGMAKAPHARLQSQLAGLWAYADGSATRLGHAYRSAYVATFLLGFLAVAIGLLGLFKLEWKPWFVGVEVLCLGLASGAFYFSFKFHIHDRWLLHRAMSEQCRPAWALAQLGLGGRRLLRPDAPWSAWALQAWVGQLGVPDAMADTAYLVALANHLRADIVTHQRQYHAENAERLRLLHEALETTGRWAFAAALGIGIAYLVANYLFGNELPHDLTVAVVTLSGAGLPSLAAAVAGLRYRGDYLRFSKRSARTAAELERLDQALAKFSVEAEDVAGVKCGNLFSQLRDMLVALETVLLDDLEDWRFVYGARPNPEP